MNATENEVATLIAEIKYAINRSSSSREVNRGDTIASSLNYLHGQMQKGKLSDDNGMLEFYVDQANDFLGLS